MCILVRLEGKGKPKGVKASGGEGAAGSIGKERREGENWEADV